jgi:hypothetical protein
MLSSMHKHLQRILFMLVLMIGFAFVASAQTVYVTNTGKKYHQDGCRSLNQSKIKTTGTAAKAKGYDACKVCTPPLAMLPDATKENLICGLFTHFDKHFSLHTSLLYTF